MIFLEDAKSAAHRIEAPKLPDALPQFTMKATVEATMKDGAEKEYTKEIEVAARSSYASLLSECGKPLPVFVRRERSRRNSLSRDGPRTKKAVIAHRSPKSPAHLLLLSANSHEEHLVLLPLPVSKPKQPFATGNPRFVVADPTHARITQRGVILREEDSLRGAHDSQRLRVHLPDE